MADRTMTWRDLRDYCNGIRDDGTLDSSVAICVDGDFLLCDISEVEKGCSTLGDLLDVGHPYLETMEVD